MDSLRWEQIQALFHGAADLPRDEQTAFLETSCLDDKTLLAEVRAMLEEDERGASLIDGDVARFAEQILDGGMGPSAIPEQFGPYRIEKALGEGGMGVVYLAKREDVGSLVAIKFLRDAWMSPVRRERFASEQRTLAQLNHPSIARLYDANTLADGTPWFVMEYVEGLPLTEYCRRHECSIEERLRLFQCVCEAVQHAHQHAVIHRDLKPSNILVKADATVRLLDFGIAKQLDGMDRPVDQTRTALRLMTPAYAAPEQIRGEQVGIFTDVYALGVILYELLAGRLPFDLANRTPGEVERAIVEQEPEKPSAAGARDALPVSRTARDDLDVLCLTAMHKDAGRRYGSVEALMRDVSHFLNGEPLEARPDTARYRLDKFMRRNWRAVSAAAVVFTIVVGLVIFFTVRLATARNAALSSAVRTQRVQRFMLNLFQGGDKLVGPAEDLRVVTLLDRGVQEAQTLKGEPQVQADLYQTLGRIYQKLGDLPRADSLLRLALERRRSLLGADNGEVAESLVSVGLLRADQAKLEEAERLVRNGLQMTMRVRPRDDEAVASATRALGKVLAARGQYDKAIPLLEQVVKLQSVGQPGSAELAASIKELADEHFYAGHYDLCETLTKRALALHRQLFGERHVSVADDLVNLVAVQQQRGHYADAERFSRQALEIDLAWYGKDHPETAITLVMIGQALAFQQRYDEAETLLEQALAIQERVYGPQHPRVAYVLNEMGGVALQRNHFDQAEACFRRILGIYKTAYGEHHQLVALALANLASVYMAREDYGPAEQMFREVVRRYSETLAPDHLNTGIAQIKLGRTLVRQQRYREAEEHTLAGYKILTKQTSPAVTWLQSARQDLITIYGALDQPEKVNEFQVELVKNGGKAMGKK